MTENELESLEYRLADADADTAAAVAIAAVIRIGRIGRDSLPALQRLCPSSGDDIDAATYWDEGLGWLLDADENTTRVGQGGAA